MALKALVYHDVRATRNVGAATALAGDVTAWGSRLWLKALEPYMSYSQPLYRSRCLRASPRLEVLARAAAVAVAVAVCGVRCAVTRWVYGWRMTATCEGPLARWLDLPGEDGRTPSRWSPLRSATGRNTQHKYGFRKVLYGTPYTYRPLRGLERLGRGGFRSSACTIGPKSRGPRRTDSRSMHRRGCELLGRHRLECGWCPPVR